MGEVEVWVHTFILALDRQSVVALLLQPLHPKYHMNWTSEAPSMLWTLQKFIPLPEFEPQFLGHAAHSPDATMTDLSRLPSSLLLPNVQHSSS